jgi:hypothetical protein
VSVVGPARISSGTNLRERHTEPCAHDGGRGPFPDAQYGRLKILRLYRAVNLDDAVYEFDLRVLLPPVAGCKGKRADENEQQEQGAFHAWNVCATQARRVTLTTRSGDIPHAGPGERRSLQRDKVRSQGDEATLELCALAG